MEKRPFVFACVVSMFLGSAAFSMPPVAIPGAPTASRVEAAEQLIRELDLSNTDYAHGQGSVTWNGTVASHTDCSGYIDHLLMHVDGYSFDDFKRWFGSRRPTAARYHDAIAERRGFAPVSAVGELQPGDVIAIKYLTRRDNTGHIMMVVEPPRRLTATAMSVAETTQWAVTVIDSAESGHGPSDTRHKRAANGRDHDGLGRGVVRLYADRQGNVAGFSWSTLKASRFIGPEDEHVALGRFLSGYKP